MFERYTDRAKKVLMRAKQIASAKKEEKASTDDIFTALLELKSSLSHDILEEVGYDIDQLRDAFPVPSDEPNPEFEPALSDGVKEALSRADSWAQKKLGHNYVGTEHILIGLVDAGIGDLVDVFDEQDVTSTDLAEELEDTLKSGKADEKSGDYGFSPAGPESGATKSPKGGKRKSSKKTGDVLSEHSRNLTAEAKANELDPVIGREEEIERIMQILARRKKNNPVLTGEPGVGKTAIVEGLAQKSARGNAPEAIRHKTILSLNLASLVSGTKYRGEFEQRMQKVRKELAESDDTIVFIDELHTVLGAGSSEGGMDAANILKPALARGEIQVIGATTFDEYRENIEQDSALERRFQEVVIEEPTIEEAVEILEGLQDRYEEHHGIKYTAQALRAAAELSHRYLSETFLPDSAIDVIDEVGSRKKLSVQTPSNERKKIEKELAEIQNDKEQAVEEQDFEKAAELRDQEEELRTKLKEKHNEEKDKRPTPVVDEEDVAQLISDISGIPVFKLTEEEKERLLRMEEELHERIVGQDEAVNAISRAIRRGRTGLKDPGQPLGSFMFLGPTGVGKTECARALAEFLFGDEDQMIRVDMSEFMEKHSVSRLEGAPPGYVGYEEGGQLTEQVRQNPYSVILLDEIEKAHADVHNILLQILEDGQLTDHNGRTVDFSNTIVIMTSNVGARQITDSGTTGFDVTQGEGLDHDKIKDRVSNELQKQFPPEFINRLDETVVFKALTEDDLRKIVDNMVDEVRERLSGKDMTITLSDPAREYLIKEGYDPEYGARPLRRTIQRKLEDPLAEAILEGQFDDGDVIEVRYHDSSLTFAKADDPSRSSESSVPETEETDT